MGVDGSVMTIMESGRVDLRHNLEHGNLLDLDARAREV